MSKSGVMSKNCKNMTNSSVNSNNNKSKFVEETKMETKLAELIKNVREENKDKTVTLLENVDLSYFLTEKNINKNSDSRILMINEENRMKFVILTPDFVLEIPFNLDKNSSNQPINLLKSFNVLNNENQIFHDNFVKKPENEVKINELDNQEMEIQVAQNENIENENDDGTNLEKAKLTKNNKKLKRKNRSMSESYCDVINKVTDHFTELNIISEDNNGKTVGQKKIRSISESGNDDHSTKIEKYRGILKHTVYNTSIAEDDDDDEMKVTSYSDGKLNENSKKSVRFNEVIRKQLFRVNSSILGQKKKNQKKKRSRKTSLTENNSDGEEKSKFLKSWDIILNRNI